MIYLNGLGINVTHFPDGTSQVWKMNENYLSQDTATITWDFSHESEIIHIAQLTNLLQFSGVEKIYLQLEFLPYGRQDKEIRNDATFGLRTFAMIVNSLYFTEVIIMDPHSHVALDLINRSKAIYPIESMNWAYLETESNWICYPDKGARIKYSEIYPSFQFMFGEKVRDQSSGHITSYDLFGDPKDKRILIVDDICDGGKTFELLADQIYSNGAEEVNLFVTHGIFSKGLKPLREAGIKRIFTHKGEAIRMADGGLGFRKPEEIKPPRRCSCGDFASPNGTCNWSGSGCYNRPA